MHVRVIDAAHDKVDILIDTPDRGAVDTHKLISRSLLAAFLEDWLAFVHRVQLEKNSRPDDRAYDREVDDRLARYGETLHALLFTPDFTFSAVKSATFAVDAAWARLPYELLPATTTERAFLGLKIPVLRQMRATEKPRALHSAKLDIHKQQYLFLANPEGAADIAQAVASEEERLQTLMEGRRLQTLGKWASVAETLEGMMHARYIHYSGHVRTQALCLRDAVITAHDVASLHLSHVQLAFMNGCNSAAGHDTTGLAHAFLSAGVQNYIGYNYPISDRAALATADGLWQAMRPKRWRFVRTRSEQLPLAQVSLDIRRRLYADFGSAELAWLGVQFFVAASTTVERTRFTPTLAVVAASALLAAAFGFYRTRIAPKAAATALETAASNRSDGVHREPQRARARRSAQTSLEESARVPAKTSEPKPSAPHFNEPAIAADTSFREKERAIHSQELLHLIADFRAKAHPFYTSGDKERILSQVLLADVSESVKIIRLKNEMP